MSNNESKVENYLKDEVKAHGGLARKWVSPGYLGVPDQIIIKPSTAAAEIERLSKLPSDQAVAQVMFVEVKTITGKLSPMQVREINRLKDAGCTVHVVYGTEDVQDFIAGSSWA